MSAENSRARQRRHKAPVPKEHGAWFMLGHCLLIGALVAGTFRAPVVLVIGASLLIFVAMQGLKQLARAIRYREHQVQVRVPWISFVFLVSGIALGGFALLFWDLDVLWYWGAIGFALTVAYVCMLFQRRERSVLGEWLGIAGITSSAGAIWSAGTGTWGREALVLWALSFLYFGGSVPYVRLRVKQMKEELSSFRTRHARDALLYSAVALLLVSLGVVSARIPALAVVPFLLTLAKVVWAVGRREGPKKIAHVGYSEAVFSTFFAVLTIAAFWP